VPKSPLKSGLKGESLPEIKSHLDVWRLIFDDEIIQQILDCTNEYGSSKYTGRDAPFPAISKEELENYFAIYFCLCLIKYPQERFPWFQGEDSVYSEIPSLYANPFISSIMGKNRWMDIHNAIHCTNKEVLKRLKCSDISARMLKWETIVILFHPRFKTIFTSITPQVSM
jgi:hypothetical protein